jgi:hypothetical protein
MLVRGPIFGSAYTAWNIVQEINAVLKSRLRLDVLVQADEFEMSKLATNCGAGERRQIN